MSTAPPLAIHRLGPADTAGMAALLDLFQQVFDDTESYGSKRPGPAYLRSLLGSDTFFALTATAAGTTVGGLAAYELRKFEQERSEIYLYDLAVADTHRRQGVATALIRALQGIAAERGAYVIFVQADLGDDPAIALYTGLGVREDVLHFDIAVPGKGAEADADPAGSWPSR